MLNDEITRGEVAASTPDEGILDWSADAPRGGKVVMGRILKERASVPLFFAQTLIRATEADVEPHIGAAHRSGEGGA